MVAHHNRTLLDRARAMLNRTAPVAALTIVPLAAAEPARAAYLHKWITGTAGFDSAAGGTRVHDITRLPTDDGDKLIGTATYTLSNTAVATITGGYSGAGAGQVGAGDRADFYWNFTLSDVGSAPISALHWDLLGIYDSIGGDVQQPTLASGDGFGTFTGAASLPFPAMNNMNWFGAKLRLTATVPGTQPGLYQMRAELVGDGIRYAFVPEPSSCVALMLSAACMLRRRRA